MSDTRTFVCLLPLLMTTILSSPTDATPRVPAEWEPHAATWMQWPGDWEAEMRPEFAEIIRVIQRYEPVHLLTSTAAEQRAAERFLAQRGVPSNRLTWHVVPVDNSWMRDNGPVYLVDGDSTWIQNWRFDAWGGNFGANIPYANDDRVPVRVGEITGLSVVDQRSYVAERGNLEFNGAGTLVLNWDCQDDRNPGLSRTEHESLLREAFGVDRIVWAHGHDPDDGTIGHIDGTARFVGPDTLAIADYGTALELDLAAASQAAGLNVVWYPGDPNWLVGNGFVAAMSSGDTATDATLRGLLEQWFPNRDIHLIDASTIARSGGGIHCVTNDQPLGITDLFGDGFEIGSADAWSRVES